LKNPRTILITAGALALLGIGFLFFRGPKPIIEIKAEKLADLGPFPLVNTYVTSLLVVAVIAGLAWLATRHLHIIPRGLQNAVEAVVDIMYTICVNTAGEKHARRFFPVVMTIFVYIWIANWMALLPVFNAIGAVQKVDAHHFHEEAVLLESTGGVGLIMPNEKELEFHADEGAIDRCGEEHAGDEAKHCEEAFHAFAIAEELEHEGYHTGLSELAAAAGEGAAGEADPEFVPPSVEEPEGWDEYIHAAEAGIEQVEDEGKELGVIIPYLRSMNTDVNSPLSIAIMAMFVAELARLISFTFRLFGNMLAGEILLLVMTFLAPFLVALPFYGLETFVGVIQAFVFAMLTLVFATLAVTSHEGHEGEHGAEEPHDAPAMAPAASH
jgi:F-type H+-transporting ATPase subunit a